LIVPDIFDFFVLLYRESIAFFLSTGGLTVVSLVQVTIVGVIERRKVIDVPEVRL